MKTPEKHLGKDYLEHKVFETLKKIHSSYDALSFGVMGFVTLGTPAIGNIDTYIFSSMGGTIDSIYDLLKKGRINDAYALLRKYNDSILINIYCNLYLEDNISIENFVVAKITNWIRGTEQMPTNRIINTYIENSPKVAAINALMKKDDTYNKIKERCNDHVHYNFYKNVLLNDNEIHYKERVYELEQINEDVQDLLILHLAYIFSIKEHYMSSSDHIDYLEVDMTPPENSQYWVANHIQDIFNTIITPRRPDITEEIKKNTCMELE